jgi:hypothetical protein
MDNSSVCSFADNEEPKVTNLLAFKIMKRNHMVKTLDALHATQQTRDILVDNTAEAQK